MARFGLVFAEYMVSVPTWLRLFIAVVVVVGVTVLFTWLLHDRILARYRASRPPLGEDGQPDPNAPPSSSDLAGHLVRVLSLAFVFILGFTLSNFWGASKAAEGASQDEAAKFNRAVVIARTIPADQGGAGLLTALDAYEQNAVNVQWALLEHGDAIGAYEAQGKAGSELFTAIEAAYAAGASKSPAWGTFTGSVDDMLTAARERVDALPSSMSNGVLWILVVLGLGNLMAIAIFAPTTLRTSLVVLGGLAALFALLLFVVVETSNPYWGAGAHMATFVNALE